MIFRVIQEAMNNTIKYAQATSVQLNIKTIGEHLELVIADDGKGFNITTVKKGAGLKNIQNRVYLTGGKLLIESAPGKGCKIIINFPINNNNQNLITMEKITILIADDHTLVRETWSFILNTDPRFNVVAESGSGEEAVELAKKLRPNIVIMDINLPGINGIEATQQIRKFSPGSRILGVSLTYPTHLCT